MSATTTSKKAVHSTNNSAIAKAWSELVVISTTGEQEAIRACLNLAKQMKASSITVRETMKVIKDTGLESPFVKVSHVEGLPTMLSMQKVAGFSALPLSKQLSTATASYKLLGAGNGEQLSSVEAIEKATAGARKAKSEKAGAPKAPKAKATQADTLASILAFITALDFSTIEEGSKEETLIVEIQATLEGKMVSA
jgi:hypothetical protein